MTRSLMMWFALLIFMPRVGAQIKIGARAGINRTTETYTPLISSSLPDPSVRFSGNGGIFAEFSINSILSLRAEVFFTGKGFQWVDEIGQTTVKTIIRPTYLQIPILIGLKETQQNGKPFIFAGPYVSFGVGGTVRGLVDSKFIEERKLSFGQAEKDDYTNVDFGLSLLAGLQFNKSIQVFLFADLGLINIIPKARTDAKSFHRTFGIGIGLSPFTIGKSS